MGSKSANRKWTAKNPDYWKNRDPNIRRDWFYRKTYGITLADYDEIIEQQGGRCAICFSFPYAGRALCVDHDHVTGAVRGLLCDACNRGIGFFQDEPELLRVAIAYLERNS